MSRGWSVCARWLAPTCAPVVSRGTTKPASATATWVQSGFSASWRAAREHEIMASGRAPARKTSRRTRRGTTIHDVARRAGVSPMTVSRVVNGERNVRETTRAAVLAAVKELRYAPNPAARSLAGAQSLRIGLLYANPSAAYLSEFLLGALDERAARARSYCWRSARSPRPRRSVPRCAGSSTAPSRASFCRRRSASHMSSSRSSRRRPSQPLRWRPDDSAPTHPACVSMTSRPPTK